MARRDTFSDIPGPQLLMKIMLEIIGWQKELSWSFLAIGILEAISANHSIIFPSLCNFNSEWSGQVSQCTAFKHPLKIQYLTLKFFA